MRLESSDHTVEQGRWLGAILRAGDLVILDGPLGAGKTTFTRGIGQGMAVKGPVTSPTFVISRVHPPTAAGVPLVHVDAYRVGSVDDLESLDLDATFEESATVVEWGVGRVEELANSHLTIELGRGVTDDLRSLHWQVSGTGWDDRIKDLTAQFGAQQVGSHSR